MSGRCGHSGKPCIIRGANGVSRQVTCTACNKHIVNVSRSDGAGLWQYLAAIYQAHPDGVKLKHGGQSKKGGSKKKGVNPGGPPAEETAMGTEVPEATAKEEDVRR